MSTSLATANDFDQDGDNLILHVPDSRREGIVFPKALLTREELLKLRDHLTELNLATVLSDATELWAYNPSTSYFPKDSCYEAEYIDSYKYVSIQPVDHLMERWLLLTITSWGSVSKSNGEVQESVFDEDLDNRHEILEGIVYKFLTEELGKKDEEIFIEIKNAD